MSGLTMCPACQAALPSGRFCAICGSPLNPVEPVPHASQPLSSPPSAAHSVPTPEDGGTQVQPRSGQPFPQPVQPADVLPVPGRPSASHTQVTPFGGQLPGQPFPQVASSSGLRNLRPGRQQAAIAAVIAVVVAAGFVVFGMNAKHTMTGDLTLTDDSLSGLSAGASCEGNNGYDDITAGAEVRVKDESGTLVATGRLQDGTFDGTSCVFPFTVTDVPRASYYEVSAGNESRGGVHFTPDEMKSQHWAAHLTLGD